MVWPGNVKLKLMHATRAGLDQTVVLAREADGTYRMPLPALAPGHWDVQLAAQDWRLTGSLYVPGDPHLVMRPGEP